MDHRDSSAKRVSKDEARVSWFETPRCARLLTMTLGYLLDFLSFSRRGMMESVPSRRVRDDAARKRPAIAA